MSRLADLRALRYATSAGKVCLLRPQCGFGKRKMDYFTLGEAAAAAMRHVSHALKPFYACGIVPAGEGEQGFAQRRRECAFRGQ